MKKRAANSTKDDRLRSGGTMIAELAFDIIDQKVVFMQPRTCKGCRFLKDGDCSLYGGQK